jgi:hypothetical protein
MKISLWKAVGLKLCDILEADMADEFGLWRVPG